MTFRIGGMASGLDTDSIVKQLMQVKKIPIDKMKQTQTKLQWTRDAYREQNTLLAQLRDLTSGLKLQSNMGAKKAASSNDATVTATGTSAAANGTYSILVDQVAKGAEMSSSTLGIYSNTSQKLNAAQVSLNVSGEKGTKTVVIPKDSTIADVVSAINLQTSSTGVRANYDQATDKLYFSTTGTGTQSYVSISAGSDAGSDTFLTGTLKLATGNSQTLGVASTTTFTKLDDVINSSLGSPASFTIMMNGDSTTTKTFTINSTTKLKDLQTEISKSFGSQVNLSLDATGKVQLTSSAGQLNLQDSTLAPGALASLGFQPTTKLLSSTTAPISPKLATDLQLDITLSTTVPPSSVTGQLKIGKNTSLVDLQDQLSRQGLADKVVLSLDSSGRVRLESLGNQTITLDDPGKTALKELGLTDGTVSTLTSASTQSMVAHGQDALVRLNGSATQSVYHSNTFTWNGLNITAKQQSAIPVSLSVSSDVDAVFGTIKAFVDKYNEITAKIYDKTHEKVERSYTPLTDDQKKDMKEADITAWETQAKTGLLSNDTILNQALNNLRSVIMNPITSVPAGQYNTMESIGITTGPYYEHGKLYIDDLKLKQALTNNPEQVMNLFTNPANTVTDTTKTPPVTTTLPETAGLGRRLFDTLTASMDLLKDKAGSAISRTDNSILGKSITDYADRIAEANAKLSRYEQQYYSQFANLESAMNKFNSQSSWLTQQLSSN